MKKGPQNGELPSRRAEAVRLDASIILNRERLRQGLVAWGFNGRLHNYGGESPEERGGIPSEWYYRNAHGFHALVSSLRGNKEALRSLYVTMIQGQSEGSMAVIVGAFQPASAGGRGIDTECVSIAEVSSAVAAEILAQINEHPGIVTDLLGVIDEAEGGNIIRNAADRLVIVLADSQSGGWIRDAKSRNSPWPTEQAAAILAASTVVDLNQPAPGPPERKGPGKKKSKRNGPNKGSDVGDNSGGVVGDYGEPTLGDFVDKSALYGFVEQNTDGPASVNAGETAGVVDSVGPTGQAEVVDNSAPGEPTASGGSLDSADGDPPSLLPVLGHPDGFTPPLHPVAGPAERITPEELVTQVMEMRDAELLQHENDERVVATRIPRMEGNGGRVLTWQLCGFGDTNWESFRGNERFHAYIDVTAEDIANMVAIVKEIANDIVSGEQKSKLEVAWLMGSSLANELENGENVGRYTSLDDSTPRIVVLSDDRRLLEEINRRLQVSSSLWKIRRSGRIDCQIMNDKGAMRVHEGARIVEPILISEANSRRVRYQRRAPQAQRSASIFEPVDGASDATAGNVIVDDSQLEASVDVISQAIERQFDDDASNARVEQITDLVDAPRYDHEFRYRGRARSGDRGQYFWETRLFGEQNVVAENNAEDVFRSYIRVPASLTGSAMEVLMDVVQEQIDANPEFSCGIRWLMGSYNERDGIQPGNYSELTVDMPQIVLYTGSQADMEEILTSLTADPRWGDIENAVDGMFENVIARGESIDCLADEYFNDGDREYRSLSLFNRGGARNPHDLPLQNIRYTDTEGPTRIASDREVDEELARLAQLRNSRAVARPSVPAPPAAVPVHAPVVVSPAIAATIPVGPPTPPLPPTAPIPPIIRPILPTIDTRVGLGNNKAKMTVPKGIASGVFSGTSELDKQIDASVANWGGDSFEKQAQSLGPEEVAIVKEISLNHYLFLRNKYSQNPEGMSPEELVAAELYQKLAEGQPLSLSENAKLYTVLGKLEEDLVADPKLQAAMKIQDMDEYKYSLVDLRQSIFINMTGINPDDTYDSQRKRLYSEAMAAVYPTAGGWRKAWERTKYILRRESSLIQDMTEIHYAEVFEANKSKFKPEEVLASTAFDGSKRGIVGHVKGMKLMSPLTAADEAMVMAARNTTELKAAILLVETHCGIGTALSDPKTGAYENMFNPEKKAYALGLEGVFAADMDRMARTALERQVGKDAVQIQAELVDLRDQIAEEKKKLAALNKANPKDPKAIAASTARIVDLENKQRIAKELSKAAQGGGAMKILEKDMDYAQLEAMVPVDYQNEFIDDMLTDLGLSPSSFSSKPDKVKAIDGKLSGMRKQRFTIASMMFGFFNKKI